MGTSITLFIEKLTDSGWVPAQKVVPKEDLWGVSYVIADEDKLRINGNYVLFALLAGVRNAQKLTPIAPRRGIPDDASIIVRQRWQDGLDGCMVHSPTHYLVSELNGYDWNGQRVSDEGFVSKEEFARVAAANFCVRPTSWRYSPEADYNEYIAWTEPAGDHVKEFTGTFLPSLARFGEADKLRLIIWFD